MKKKDSLKQQFLQDFEYLANQDSAYLKILDKISDVVTDYHENNGQTHYGLGENGVLIANPPSTVPKLWPSEFQKIMARHGKLAFFPNPLNKWGLVLGNHGTLPVAHLDETSALLSSGVKTSDLLSPILDFSDWWIYDPRQNNSGPFLCELSHEDLSLSASVEIEVGHLFLHLLAKHLDLDYVLPYLQDQTSSLVKGIVPHETLNLPENNAVCHVSESVFLVLERSRINTYKIRNGVVEQIGSTTVDLESYKRFFDSENFFQHGYATENSIFWFGHAYGWLGIRLGDFSKPVIHEIHDFTPSIENGFDFFDDFGDFDTLDSTFERGTVIYWKEYLLHCPSNDIHEFQYQKLEDNADPETFFLEKDIKNQFVKDVVVNQDKLILAGQNGMSVFGLNESPFGLKQQGSVVCNMAWPRIIPLTPDLIAIGEVDESSAEAALYFYDISNADPKLLVNFAPNHNVVRWFVDATKLWVLMNETNNNDNLTLKCYAFSDGIKEQAAYRLKINTDKITYLNFYFVRSLIVLDAIAYVFCETGMVFKYHLNP